MPVAVDLARFLQYKGMNLLRSAFRELPVEDRIEQLTRVILLALLLATLYSIV